MTEVNYNGKEELLMADYEGISDSDLTSKYANTDFDITDAPSTYITNDQMTYALTCKRLFPAGDTYICNDEGTYKKGHTYIIKVDGATKSWEDVTPTQTIDDTPTATSNNPVKSSGIYTVIQGKQDKLTAGTGITIDQDNVISSSVDESNLVTTNTKQTITAKKIINENPLIFGYSGTYTGVRGAPFTNGGLVFNKYTANGDPFGSQWAIEKTNSTTETLRTPGKSGTLALISDIDAKVPNAPDTDGTYTLKCFVSNGVKTYQWVLDA